MQEVKEYAKSEEVLTDKLVVGIKEMFESVSMNPKRTAFLADAAKSCLKMLSYHEQGKSKNSYSEDASDDWNLWNNEEMYKSGAREIK